MDPLRSVIFFDTDTMVPGKPPDLEKKSDEQQQDQQQQKQQQQQSSSSGNHQNEHEAQVVILAAIALSNFNVHSIYANRIYVYQ